MCQEKAHDRVELEEGALEDGPKWDVLLNPVLCGPVSHQCGNAETSGNWESLEVLGLAVRVLRHIASGHVEACQSGQTREDEACEEKLIKGRSDAQGKCGSGRCTAEGDLCHMSAIVPTLPNMLASYQICQRIKLSAHQAALLPPPCYSSIEEVKEHACIWQCQCRPEVSLLLR